MEDENNGLSNGPRWDAEVIERAKTIWDRGQQYLNEGRYDEAAASFRDVLDLMPGYPYALNRLGVSLIKQGDADGARGYFEQALASRPDFVPALSNLANMFLDAGEIDKAIELYTEALSHDPDYATARNNLAAAYKRKNDYTSFVREIKRSQKLIIRQGREKDWRSPWEPPEFAPPPDDDGEADPWSHVPAGARGCRGTAMTMLMVTLIAAGAAALLIL